MIMFIDIIVLQFKGDFFSIFVENSKKWKGKHNTNKKHKKYKEHGKSWKGQKKGKLITEKLICCDPFV